MTAVSALAYLIMALGDSQIKIGRGYERDFLWLHYADWAINTPLAFTVLGLLAGVSWTEVRAKHSRAQHSQLPSGYYGHSFVPSLVCLPRCPHIQFLTCLFTCANVALLIALCARCRWSSLWAAACCTWPPTSRAPCPPA